MKKIIVILIILIGAYQVNAQKISPYIKVTESTRSIAELTGDVAKALSSASFSILGTYHPAGWKSLSVLVFTRNDVKNTVVKVKDRGALAAAFKIGFVRKNGKTAVSYTNPEYILRAYLRGDYGKYKSVFNKFNSDLKVALSKVGSDFTSFGGSIEAGALKKYHYKIMMPYFTDPVELKTFNSFSEGLKTIQNNLIKHKSGTLLVYKIIYKSKNVAVFGVGLKDKVTGEGHFLPKIGISNIAAMPYEIILQGNKATMLNGKYRLAISWPELSMGTFMRIVSTPGDIEDTLKSICE